MYVNNVGVNYLTARQVAEKYGVAKRVVQGWCERRLLPNATKIPTIFGFEIWQIPESDLRNFTPPGRPGRPASFKGAK